MGLKWFALFCVLAPWVAPVTSAPALEPDVEFAYDPELSQPEFANKGKAWPTTTYKSSNIQPPLFNVTISGRPLAPGFLLVTPEKNGVLGAYMFTNKGDLVWNGYPHRLVSNSHTALLNGQKVLSTWVGRSSTLGFGYGATSILDRTYNEIHYICPKLGLFIPKFDSRPLPPCQGDLHESEITTNAQLIVTAYNVTPANLESVGGPKKGWAIDGQFHVIDIATKKNLFRWSSLEHIPLTKSQKPLGNSGTVDTKPYDYFHINSIVAVPGRNQYLVSSRHTSSIYLIDSDGSVVWTFSGTDGGDFAPLPNEPNNNQHFAFQHQARIVSMTENTMTISLFNDDSAQFDKESHPSTGIIYRLDTESMTCTEIRVVHDRKEELFSLSQGGFDVIPTNEGRHYLLAYGFNPVVKEFGPQGTIDLRLSVRFGYNGKQQFYRAYKDVWHATPTTLPDVAVDSSNGYVSWNGATDVTRYVVYYGTSRSDLNGKLHVVKTGFETTFPLPEIVTVDGGFIKVAAFDDSTFLRNSSIKRVRPQ